MSLGLAATLAVGMVPAVAFADAVENDDTTDAIELQATSAVTAFNGGKVTAATNADSSAIADLTAITYAADGKSAFKPVITQVTDSLGKVYDLTDATTAALFDATWVADDNKDGKYVSTDDTTPAATPTTPGTYFAVLTGKSGQAMDGAVIALKYTVTASSLDGAKAYTGAKVNSDAMVYNGAAQTINFTLDGEKALGADSDYVVDKVYQINDKGVSTDVTTSVEKANEVVEITNAGKYVAVLQGKSGSIYDTVKKTQVEFEVAALDLSKATIAPKAAYDGAAALVKTNVDITPAGAKAALTSTAETTVKGNIDEAVLTSSSTGRAVYDGTAGTWTYTLAASANQTNVINSATVTYTKADAALVLADFTYDGEAIAAGTKWTSASVTSGVLTAAYATVDHSAATPVADFDTSKIKVIDSASSATTKPEIPSTITVTKDGKDYSGTVLSEPGTYQVKIEAVASDYSKAGSGTITVTVTEGSIDLDTNLYFIYDGTALAKSGGNEYQKQLTYNGADQWSDFGVVVKDAKGNDLVAGTDYEVVLQKSSKDVTEVADAGAYTVTVKSSKYTFTNNEDAKKNFLTITVGAVALNGSTGDAYTKAKVNDSPTDTLRVAGLESNEAPTPAYELRWKGADLVPTFEYRNGTDDKGTAATTDDVYTFASLDSSLYTLTLKKDGTDVKAVNGPGTYTYSLAKTTEAAADNFSGWGTTAAGTFVVVAEEFTLNNATPVSTAGNYIDGNGNEAGTITGINTGKQDVAVGDKVEFEVKALDGYKIAGVNATANGEAVEITEKDGKYSFEMPGADVELKIEFSIDGQFTDTEGSVFEGVINQAATAGLVHGYKDGSFRPNNKITRAEVATILYNAAVGDSHEDETTQAGDNSKNWNTGFDDVSGSYWAAEYIAWAKAAGVVNGNGGKFRPNDQVTREEFAAMLANYAENVVGAKSDGSAPISRVKDFDKVSSWFKDVVKWAVTNEIMGNGGTVNPKANATRGEVTAMLVNYLDTTGYFD